MLRNTVIKHDKVKLPDIDLFTLNNSKANLDSIIKCKKYSLIILFSPSDCGNCLEQEKILWNDLSVSSEIQLLGISYHEYLYELKDYVKNEQLKFEVFQDKNGKFIKWLSPLKSPCKILINKERNVIFVDNNIRISSSSRNRFLNLLKLLN